MPLADLLQWVEQARRNVRIEVERGSGLVTWLIAVDRAVIATSMPHARGSLSGDGTAGSPGPGLRAAAIETLLDLFLDDEGRFVVRPLDAKAAPEQSVPVDVPIGFLVMEGLRQLDEWPRLASTYPDDGARLRAKGSVASDELPKVQSEIVLAARQAPTLGELRIVLGLSRPALLRRVDELRAIGLVDVDGAAAQGTRDLTSNLIEQAAVLVGEEQFAEAEHVLRSLLGTSEGDPRVRRLLEHAERAHLAACYAQLAKTDVVRVARAPSAALGSADQAVLDALAQKPRSVAALVMLSPLRELETLVALLRLVRKGIVETLATT